MFTMEQVPIAPFRESELAKLLNQNRKTLAEIRLSVLDGDDWYREEGSKPESFRPVWLNQTGLDKLLTHFGIKVEVIIEEKKNSAANAAEVRTVTVKRLINRNPYLIEVLEADGSAKIMRVKDSSKWIVGMKCDVRDGGTYTKWLIPLRNPRYRGRF